MTRASRLRQLQEIDLAIDRAKGRLADIQKLMDDDRELAAAKADLAEAERNARQAGESVRAAEHAVADQQAKLREVESKLYGGTIHNPKELQDLQMDADALKRHLATLDERLLDLMLVQEEADKALLAAQTRTQSKEADRRNATAGLRAEKTRLESEVERHGFEREPVVAGVPPEDLALYDRMRQSSGGVAVALVTDGACGVCGLVLSASGAQEVRSAPAPVRCRQCGRVLYSG